MEHINRIQGSITLLWIPYTTKRPYSVYEAIVLPHTMFRKVNA